MNPLKDNKKLEEIEINNKYCYLLKGQSSPGSLQSGQQPSKAILQIPQVSSWASHVHDATACHLKVTKKTF